MATVKTGPEAGFRDIPTAVWSEVIYLDANETPADAGWQNVGRDGFPQPGEAMVTPEQDVIYVRNIDNPIDEDEDGLAEKLYGDSGWHVLERVPA